MLLHPNAGLMRLFRLFVLIVQYSNNPDENKNITMPATPDGMYTLPAGSITVLRGKLR